MFVLSVILGVTTFVFLILYLAITTMRRKSMAIMASNFSEEEMLRSTVSANFFGITSKGMGQMRGNGPMVLTKYKLWFMLLMPSEVIEIPLLHITGMEIRKSHLGKMTPYPLLYVEFTVGTAEDSAAWLVRDPQKWIDHMNDLRAALKKESENA